MISMLAMLAAASQPGARCAIEGWSIDTDRAGLRVHAGPSLDAREIGRLPRAVEGDDHYAPGFAIVDVEHGWVRIARADDAENPGHPRPVFAGTGWVHASRVAFTIQSGIGRARPDRRSPAVVRLGDWLGDGGGAVQPIVACSGGWARLRYAAPAEVAVKAGPRSGEAWFGGICGNQHTTCDGIDEERSAPGR